MLDSEKASPEDSTGDAAVVAVMQGFCHCLHPTSLDFQTDAPAHTAKLREGGSVLAVLAWFLLLSRLLPAIQSRMVSSV